MTTVEAVVFSIQGMHCPSCPALIDDDLADLAGVHKAHTDLAAEQCTVEFDPAQTSVAAIQQVIEAAGDYTVTVAQ